MVYEKHYVNRTRFMVLHSTVTAEWFYIPNLALQLSTTQERCCYLGKNLDHPQ